jgi:hypothetical protein
LDRQYVPDWGNADTKKWLIYPDYPSGAFVTDYEFSVIKGYVHFSSAEVAQKCADWMNAHWHD